ncbi:hypothetical protein C8J57DRAFT_1253674 [Mycena rebaudengoi]|nr:hypothetical protein C8J57DRAFT_1253674 [Mycena rebaudengoi]
MAKICGAFSMVLDCEHVACPVWHEGPGHFSDNVRIGKIYPMSPDTPHIWTKTRDSEHLVQFYNCDDLGNDAPYGNKIRKAAIAMWVEESTIMVYGNDPVTGGGHPMKKQTLQISNLHLSTQYQSSKGFAIVRAVVKFTEIQTR